MDEIWPEVEFIAGELSAEYLSGYFADNVVFGIFCSLVMAAWVAWLIVKLLRRR